MVETHEHTSALLGKSENSKSTAHNGIKVLTYNLFMRPPPINNGGTDYKDERLHYFNREYLPTMDIIAFQECFTLWHDRKHTVIEKAREAGLKHHATSSMPDFYSGIHWDGG